MFFAAIAILVALIGWIASNYLAASGLVMVLAVVGIANSGVYVVYQYRLIKQLIEELKNVE